MCCYSSTTSACTSKLPLYVWRTADNTTYSTCTSNTPHVVSDLSHLVLVADFGWKNYAFLPDDVKKSVYQNISQLRLLVYPSLNKRSFIHGKSVIPLEVLVDALRNAGDMQVVLYSYRMKATGVLSVLQNLQITRSPIAPCHWDIGVEFKVEDGRIPLLFLDKGVSRGKIYLMLLFKEGSVEKGKVFPHCVLS